MGGWDRYRGVVVQLSFLLPRMHPTFSKYTLAHQLYLNPRTQKRARTHTLIDLSLYLYAYSALLPLW